MIAFSILLYVIAALLVPALGIVPIAIVLAGWAAFVGLAASSGQRVAVMPAWLQFGGVFALITAAEAAIWPYPPEPNALVGTFLYFFVVPSLVVALAGTTPTMLAELERGVRLAFWAMSGCTLYYGLFAGIDLDRNILFIPALNKNGMAAIYEVLFLYTFASTPRLGARLGALLTAIVALLVIGSKTAVGLALLFALGVWARPLFMLGAPAALAYLVVQVQQFDPASPLRTAGYRLLTWAQAWEEITATPATMLFGNGPGTFVGRVEIVSVEGVRSPHNLILHIWHGYGLVMLVLFLLLLGWIWRRLGVFVWPGIAAFWLFNAHALFDVGWVSGMGFGAALVLGMGLATATLRVAKPVPSAAEQMPELQVPVAHPVTSESP